MIQNVSEWLELEAKMAFKTTLTAFPADSAGGKDDEHSQGDRSLPQGKCLVWRFTQGEPSCCLRTCCSCKDARRLNSGEGKRRKKSEK